jgi:hypothetical protein
VHCVIASPSSVGLRQERRGTEAEDFRRRRHLSRVLQGGAGGAAVCGRGRGRGVANVLDVPLEALGGGSRAKRLQRARELVMLVGVELCGLKVKDLAVVIGRGAGSASRLHAQAAAERRTDPAVTALAERVTKTLRKNGTKLPRRQ